MFPAVPHDKASSNFHIVKQIYIFKMYISGFYCYWLHALFNKGYRSTSYQSSCFARLHIGWKYSNSYFQHRFKVSTNLWLKLSTPSKLSLVGIFVNSININTNRGWLDADKFYASGLQFIETVMFGRRRPLLGAAVVIGASRSAARREVQRQGESTAAAQAQQIEQQEQAEIRRQREEAEQDKRTKSAIEEALIKERARVEETLPSYRIAQSDSAGKQYCPACGQLSKRDDKFCPACGRRHLRNGVNDGYFDEG
jgi:zinc-ribbon domain